MDGKDRWMDNTFIEQDSRFLKYRCVDLNAFEIGSELRAGASSSDDTARRVSLMLSILTQPPGCDWDHSTINFRMDYPPASIRGWWIGRAEGRSLIDQSKATRLSAFLSEGRHLVKENSMCPKGRKLLPRAWLWMPSALKETREMGSV